MGKKRISFGERVVQLREAAGLTREQLAEMAGTTRQHLWRIETDEQVPSWTIVKALADALKVSTEEFP